MEKGYIYIYIGKARPVKAGPKIFGVQDELEIPPIFPYEYAKTAKIYVCCCSCLLSGSVGQ